MCVSMLLLIMCCSVLNPLILLITPHTQREWGKVTDVGIYIMYMYIYIAYYTSKSGIWLVISRVASYFHEPKASANIAYE